jgi:hypothetical protein
LNRYTALRYFYDLKRFLEDIDLDCYDLSRSQFTVLTDNLLKEIQAVGFDDIIEDKGKYENLKVFRKVFVFNVSECIAFPENTSPES